MRLSGIAVGLAMVSVAMSACAQSPKPTVGQFLNGVRAKYATEPTLAAEGFACEVRPQWREFPQAKYLPAGSPLLDRLKKTRVRLTVARGGAPLIEVDKAKKPQLNVRDLATADELAASVRQMVQGFYETWLAFGINGPSAPADASIQTVTVKPVGHETVILYKQGEVTNWMSFDDQSRMLRFTQLLPHGNAVQESPQFVASSKGLLYTGTNFEIHSGSAEGKPDTLGSYRVQYTKVDGVKMPKTLEVEVNGTLDVHFEFSNCRVGN